MRPQLLFGGLLVGLMGAGFWALEIPLVYFWGPPFVIGGGLMALASFFMADRPGPVQPPPGFTFCVFCSSPVRIGSERCSHCNGLQPKEGT
ncbi:MAG: hypothetical protein HY297_00240 [Thaumarchaeota archaeon]|nr:hypothetical protein [Nitrososphaerota archaeon]